MITGKEFNEQNKGVRFVKLTNESCCHNGFEFKEGLNVDTVEFDEKEECCPGGLYFCKYEDFGEWIKYGNHEKMEYIWDVTIPDEEKVINMGKKLKVHSFILLNKQCIWNNNDICLEVVKQNGYALEYVKEQTEEICLEAVKQNGLTLCNVKEQTEEICLEAVKQYGRALKYVKEEFKVVCQDYLDNS